MSDFVLKEIKVDLTEFLSERSSFTEFGRIVCENLRPIGRSFIVVPEDFVFENQSFEYGHLFPAGALQKLNEYLNLNSDVTLLLSDDYWATKTDGFLKNVVRTYYLFNDKVIWTGEPPMDEDSLSGALNSDPVHSLTLGIKNQKIKEQKYEIDEKELITCIKNTKFLIFSIFDDETFLVLEIS